MKQFNKKNLFSTIVILLLLSFVVSMLAVPNVNAQSTREIVTWPFVDTIPQRAGVGQPVLINWGLLNYLNFVDDGWNVTLQITYPNGKIENISAKTWSTGTVGRKFTFMDAGNYTLQTFFDGETYRYGANQANGGYFKPSKSEPFILQIEAGYWKLDHPGHTLPEEYWTRPVDSQLREWYSIMGSWLAGSRSGPNGVSKLAPYNKGPESAHVLWSMPMEDANGGLAGGETGTVGFQMGDAYEGKFYDAVIVAGVLYYNREYVSSGGASTPLQSQSLLAIDIHTGKLLWERHYDIGTGRVARGQIMTYITENNRGAWSYLWIVQGTNMWALDAKNGDLRYNMTNVPTGTIYYGPSGEMLKYRAVNYGTTDNPNWYLQQWNSSYVVSRTAPAGSSDAWGNQVNAPDRNTGAPKSYDAGYYDINVSISGLRINPGTLQAAFPENRVIFSTTPSVDNGFVLTAISLDAENLGYIYFSRQFTPPSDWADFDFGYTTQNNWSTFDETEMIGIFWTNRNRVNYAFSLETGKHLWTTEPRNYADSWSGAGGQVAYGKFYTSGNGCGTVYCYDVKTGELLWTYDARDKHNESYHNENWWLVLTFVTDGKLYYGHYVHSPQVPLPRGAPFLCLDAETGDLIWEIDGAFRQSNWGGRAMISDSIIVTQDSYDGQMYGIGKGPSELTVTAPNIAITAGTTALISGTVMDVSPGTQSDKSLLRFPKGVPAVSDESMSDWMLYVYKQFARPMDVTGVEVTVFAKQGATEIDIGTTTTTSSGTYSIAWTPPEDATGTWDIYAYFDGSASYYGSWSQTAMAVSTAPTVVDPVQPPYGWYILGVGIAIIVVVLVCMLMIYKKIDKKH